MAPWLFLEHSSIFLVLWAFLCASLWQFSGSYAVFLGTQRILKSKHLAFFAAWLLWPAAAGSLALGYALTFGVHVTKTICTVTAAIILSYGSYHLLSSMRNRSWQRIYGSNFSQMPTSVLCAYMVLMLLACGTIQGHYDQLNYHLVVAKNFMVFEHSTLTFDHIFDYHVLMSGIYEYTLVWPRLLWNNDLFSWSFGHTQTALLFLGTVVLAVLSLQKTYNKTLTRHTPLLLLCTLLLLPSVLPDSSIYRMFKPDFYLLCGALGILTTLITTDDDDESLSFTILILPSLMAFKLTGIHVVLAFLPIVVFKLGKTKRLFQAKRIGKYLLLGLLACIPFVIILTKNALILHNPVFPAAQTFFSSPYTDQVMINYWKSVSSVDQARFYSGFLGFSKLFADSWALLLLSLSAMIYLLKRKQYTREILLCGQFCLFYAMLWPLFYHEDIFFRFVSAGLGGFLVLILLVGTLVFQTNNPRAAYALVVLCLLLSGIDVQIQKVYRATVNSLQSYVSTHIETYDVSTNLSNRLAFNSTIVADFPAKYLFTQKIAFFSTSASIAERRIMDDLSKPSHFAEGTKNHSISAIVSRPGSALDLIAAQHCKSLERSHGFHIYVIEDHCLSHQGTRSEGHP